MHNKQPYSFEKTDVRGRFLLKFSCTNVKLETVIPIAANDTIEDIIAKLDANKYRDCDCKWLNEKLQQYMTIACESFGLASIVKGPIEEIGRINTYSYLHYKKYFSCLLEYFKTFK